jgi:predicted HTH transcriptional regulator
MIAGMRDLGLPAPEFQSLDGHFVVTFLGPGDSLDQVKPKSVRTVFEVAPSDLDRLTANQKFIVHELLAAGQIQVPALVAKLKVTEQAVRKDMARLVKLKLVAKRGAARATYYVLIQREDTP